MTLGNPQPMQRTEQWHLSEGEGSPKDGMDHEQKKEFLKKKKKLVNYLFIIGIPSSLLPGVITGLYVPSLVITINIVVGGLAFNQYVSGLLELYETDSYSSEKHSKIMLKIMMEASAAVMISMLVLMWHFGLLEAL